MASAVLPYDVIIWAALFGIMFVIGLIVLMCCFIRREDAEARLIDEPEVSCCRIVLRVIRLIVACTVISYAITMIIIGILGATGLMESSFFTPAAPSTCSATCTYTVKDGIDGWVDEACCTYQQNYGQIDVWLTTNPGRYVLHGWLMVNSTPAFIGQPRLTILYNHGSGGNVAMGYRHQRYLWLLSQGNVAIFSYDYAGYGKSTGSASANSLLESARTAASWLSTWEVTWLTNTTSFGSVSAPLNVPAITSPIPLQRVTILGRSMGSMVATYVGAQAANWTVQAVILQSSLSSLGRLWEFYFPVAGWIFRAMSLSRFPDFDNLRHVPGYNGCLYMAHSSDDEWVPLDHGRATYEIAEQKRPACSQFAQLSGAIHTEPLTLIERTTLAGWLNQARFQASAFSAAPVRSVETEGKVLATPIVAFVMGTIIAILFCFVIELCVMSKPAPKKKVEPETSA